MNVLEQLPRLCSPTICGTLSQPTTKNERVSCGAQMLEWSMEQVNITTSELQNLADLYPSWRQQESETFFSQRTIAPSPMVTPKNIYQHEDDDDEEEQQQQQEDIIEEDEEEEMDDEEDYMDEDVGDDFLFSPQPIKSSQSQQTMDVFSPGTFSRVMEDENTLQSTPKTTGTLLQRPRPRRVEM